MDKSTRHLPARLAPLFHGVGTIIHETGVERAASTGYVASAAGPREGLKRSDSQTTFADDVRPPTPPSLEEHDFDRERLKATRDRTDAVWAACAASRGKHVGRRVYSSARGARDGALSRGPPSGAARYVWYYSKFLGGSRPAAFGIGGGVSVAPLKSSQNGPVPLALPKGEGGGHGATGPRRRGLGVAGVGRGRRAARCSPRVAIGFAAKAESCVLCAPRSVDADELARLLAPPKELEALQARLLLRATPTSHGGAAAGRRRAKRFMTLMTGWIDDLHALGLELETAVLAPCLEPPSKRSLLGFLRKNPPTENTRVVGRPKSAVERGNPALAVTGEKEFDAEEIKLREEIGQGRGGLVRRGVYRGRDVAVKLVFSEALASTRQRGPSELRTEFDRVVAMLRRVSHINCVAFFGTFGDPKYGAHGLVMEFLRDGSLQQRLEAPHLPSVDDVALQLADGVAAGLAHLHGVGILHRDLKPANVLLDGDRAKLADFGYSSAVVGDGADQSVCGTPRWMAPEVVFGRPYSFGADVYSYALDIVAATGLGPEALPGVRQRHEALPESAGWRVAAGRRGLSA